MYVWTSSRRARVRGGASNGKPHVYNIEEAQHPRAAARSPPVAPLAARPSTLALRPRD